jgi:5-(carboxyamino)imidazole ribonucleotide mutase
MEVLIILGSKSDLEIGNKALSTLEKLGIGAKLTIASAHRTPDVVIDLVGKSSAKVFIAIAGLSAALPGFVAAHTNKPVIGVPVSGKVNLDSILSITQMPPGIPVAAVGLDAGENAAVLAAQMLAIGNPSFGRALDAYRRGIRDKVLSDAKEVGGE